MTPVKDVWLTHLKTFLFQNNLKFKNKTMPQVGVAMYLEIHTLGSVKTCKYWKVPLYKTQYYHQFTSTHLILNTES